MGSTPRRPKSSGNDDLDRIQGRGKHGRAVTDDDLDQAAERGKVRRDQQRREIRRRNNLPEDGEF